MNWDKIAKSIRRHYGLRYGQVVSALEWAEEVHYDPRGLGAKFWASAHVAWVVGNDAHCWE